MQKKYESVAPFRATRHLLTEERQRKADIIVWDDLDAWMDLDRIAAADAPCIKQRSNGDRYEPENWGENCGEWAAGGDDIDTVRRYWKDGYMADEVTALASKLAAKAEGRIVNRKRRRRYGMVGELDGDRWSNGDYQTAWIDRPRTGAGTSPIVNVVFNYGANSGAKAEQLQWSGIAGAALAKALEDAGWRVGLYALNTMYINSSDNRQVSCNLIPVKAPEELLRPGQVGAMFAHPASFRIRCFRAMEGLARWDAGSHLGYSRSFEKISPLLKPHISELLGGNTQFVDQVLSEDKAVDAIKATLDKVTNPLMTEVG